MSTLAITVTDHALAHEVGQGIVVGRSFAFLPADLLERPALRWVRSLVPAIALRPRVVSLLDPIELPGLLLRPIDRPALATAVVTSDKALYREGADVVNVLVCDPLGAGREVEVELELSGQPFGHRPVRLSAHGAGALALRDLPTGDYKLRMRGAPASDPACAFTVAEYRLSPLVAALERQRFDSGRLALDVRLVAFGVPATGTVHVDLLDAGRRIDRIEVTARDGALAASFELRGDGPHTVNFQLAADPGRTATIPLVGSRAAERRDTVFSTLGAEILGSALPSDDASEVRGLFLRRGGASSSPVRLDRVDARAPKLTAMIDLEALTIAIIDPTLRRNAVAAAQADALPAGELEAYTHGEQLFAAGRYEAALETFTGARARAELPHPNYAYWIACCHARLGNRAAGIAALRTAVREGWADLAHMRADHDLAALRDDPDFALIAGGGVRIVETALRTGESLTLDVPAPLAYVAVGAFVDGQPWEGHAAIVAPPAATVELDVPAVATPGTDVTIGIRTAGDAAVYVVVKDARLLSADTPTSRLGAQLKAHVDAMRARRVLGSGIMRDTLASLLPAPPPPPRSRGSEMSIGSAPSGSPRVYSMPPSAMSPQGMIPPSAPSASRILPGPAGGPALAPAAAPARRSAPARAAVEEVPEVVFAGLVPARAGHATVTVTLGGAFADYLVEAFVLDGLDWAAATARFRAARVVFAAFEVPPFVRRDDAAVGRLVIGGGGAGMAVELTHDGVAVPVVVDGQPLPAGGVVRGPRAELAFVAGPGDYAARLVDAATGEVVHATARIDEPGKLRRIARTMRMLQPGERVSRQDDPSIVSLRALPGLDQPFSVLCDATADYGHACCEQTAAKMLAACTMYLFAGDDHRRRDRAEEIVIAGVRRERTMFLPRRGFKMYPDSSYIANDYWGSLAARHLWNLDLLRTPAASRALTASIDDALEMARDATTAYKLEWPPRVVRTPAEAYGAIRFGEAGPVKDAALGVLQAWANAARSAGPAAAMPRGAVGFRADAAYAAAGLFRAAGPAAIPTALGIANRVVGDLGTDGRLYSTVDSVAAIAMMTEMLAANIIGRGASSIEGATEIAARDSTVAVEVTRIVEDDWDRFVAKLPITVATLVNGRATERATLGDAVDLHIRVNDGYQPGDLVWVALPAALSRVIGGGQVKRFSVDLAGAAEVTIPLAATALTVDRAGDEAPQHFAVCVRNMFEEERAGNPGPLEISVVPPRGEAGPRKVIS